MVNPASCSRALREDMSAATTKGPTASRRQLWAELASKAGFPDLFYLEPELIYQVMGALKLAGFRLVELYLDTAKSQHVAAGYLWSSQLQQWLLREIEASNALVGHSTIHSEETKVDWRIPSSKTD